MTSFLPLEIPQNSMAGKQILQISYIQFDNLHCIIIYVLEDKIQNHVSSCSDFPLDVLDQRSGDGRFSGCILNHRDQLQVRISRISNCWTRELLLL